MQRDADLRHRKHLRGRSGYGRHLRHQGPEVAHNLRRQIGAEETMGDSVVVQLGESLGHLLLRIGIVHEVAGEILLVCTHVELAVATGVERDDLRFSTLLAGQGFVHGRLQAPCCREDHSLNLV